MIETDLMGTPYGSYYAYRQFLTQGAGTLGKHTVPYYTSYIAAKHGIVAQKMTAKVMHQAQFEKAPAGPDTPGGVLQPMPRGTEVKAGRTEQRHWRVARTNDESRPSMHRARRCIAPSMHRD